MENKGIISRFLNFIKQKFKRQSNLMLDSGQQNVEQNVQTLPEIEEQKTLFAESAIKNIKEENNIRSSIELSPQDDAAFRKREGEILSGIKNEPDANPNRTLFTKEQIDKAKNAIKAREKENVLLDNEKTKSMNMLENVKVGTGIEDEAR